MAMESTEQLYIEYKRNAHFVTHYYNYDQGWPSLTEELPESCNKDDGGMDTIEGSLPTLFNSVCQSTNRVKRLREQIATRKKQILEARKRTQKMLEKDGMSPELANSPVKLSEFVNSKMNSNKSQLERERSVLKELGSMNRLLDAKKSVLVNSPIRDVQMKNKINEYLSKWKTEGLGIQIKNDKDNRVTLRIGTSNSDGLGFPVSLVRGVQRWDAYGHLQFCNLEVISNQRPDAQSIAKCAEASMTPSALISCLLSSLHVDRLLQTSIKQLRSQHPLDWNADKRELHFLGGARGEVLATIHISSDSLFRLLRVQYHPPTEGDACCDTVKMNELLQSKLIQFTPPMSTSLEEWIGEVRDFCLLMSDSLD